MNSSRASIIGVLARLLAAVSLLLVVSDCSLPRGLSDHFITLRYWNPFTGPDGRTMLQLVKRFNQGNPGVRVIMQRMESETYYNKLFVAGKGGRAPDVFVVHNHALVRFVDAGFIRSVDDLVGHPGQIDPSDFDPNVWAAVEYLGKHWSIPLDVHPMGMYYNRKLLREAGIVDARGNPKPPTNRREFLEDLRKFHQLKQAGRLDAWGYVFTWLRTNCYALIRQNEGRIFNDSFSQCTLDSPQNVQTLSWCADLVQREKLVPSPENFDAWIGFRQGRVAIVFEGIYMLQDLKNQTDLDWGAAPLPLIFQHRATWAASHGLAFRADLSGDRLDAARRFVKFLSDNSLDWAEAGQIPVRRSLRRSARFQQMYAQREFAKEIPYVQYFPATPFIFEYLDEYDQALDSAIRGSLTPRAALSNASKRIDRIISRYRQDAVEASR